MLAIYKYQNCANIDFLKRYKSERINDVPY
jgi:hypothetical protein